MAKILQFKPPAAHAATCDCDQCLDAVAEELAAIDRLDRLAFESQVRLMKERLRKLSVAEVRVLARHYFGKYFDAEDMRKADLIDEIAPEIVTQEEF